MEYKSDINKSILNKNNVRLLIDKVPTVEYYVRSCNIPGVQFSEAVQPTGQGIDAFFPGDKASFDKLKAAILPPVNKTSEPVICPLFPSNVNLRSTTLIELPIPL